MSDNPAIGAGGIDLGGPIQPGRRRFLTGLTAAVGAAGVAALAVPFVEYWQPSERAIAGAQPVDVDIGKLEVGQKLTVMWQRKPVWIIRRSKEQVEELPKLNPLLKDPLSKEPQQPSNLEGFLPEQRSLKERPEHLVVVAICTHLGCVPDYVPQRGWAPLGADWPGGLFCPCHGSRYDLAARVMQGSPAPLNLPVPPYYYREAEVVRIGELKDGKDQHWTPAVW